VRGEVRRGMGSGQVRTLTHYVADGETRRNMKVRPGEVNGCAVLYKGPTPTSLDLLARRCALTFGVTVGEASSRHVDTPHAED
jgi:hypothetical protein